MRASLLLLLVALTPLVWAVEIPDIPDIGPGIERGEWSVEAWGNPGAVERVDAKTRKLMKLMFVPAGKEKAAFHHATGMGIAKKGKLSLQVYCEKPVDLSIALSTTAAYLYHEAKSVALKAGWNKVEFDVSAPSWKTASSEWAYTQEVEAPGDVRAIDVLVYNKKSAGELYVIGMQYEPDDATKDAEKLAKDLSLDDADKRAASERALLALGTPALEVLHQVIAREDKPEIQIRATLLVKALETPATPPSSASSALAGQTEQLRHRAMGSVGNVGEADLDRDTPFQPRAAVPAKAPNLPEVLASAEKQLQSLRTELNELHEQTASLVKTVDEASNLVKQIKEKEAPKVDEKAPEKQK